MKWTTLLIIGGISIAGLALYQILCNDFSLFASNLPAIAVSQRAENYIRIDRCEIHSSEIHCNLTNTLRNSQVGLDVGDIGVNLLSATYHDKNGKKVGGRQLPSRKISSGESIRDVVVKHQPIREIATVRIDWD